MQQVVAAVVEAILAAFCGDEAGEGGEAGGEEEGELDHFFFWLVVGLVDLLGLTFGSLTYDELTGWIE